MRTTNRSRRSGAIPFLFAALAGILVLVPSKSSAQALERVAKLSSFPMSDLMPMAKKGDVNAEEAIGLKDAYAEGVKWNFSKGIKWLRKAAQGGSVDADCSLGQIYDNGLLFTGHHVAPNDAKAVKWYRRAAEKGWCWLQLAEAYDDKAGSDADQKNRALYERDERAAAHWWRKEAQPRTSYPAVYPYAKFPQGNPMAQEHMGYLYRLGMGVPQSYKRARMWYRRAAEQPFGGGAMMSLGYFYEHGLGVPVNDELAYIYYGLTPQGLGPRCHQCMKGELIKLAKKMTPQQVLGAQAIVSEWHPGMPLPAADGLAEMADRAEKEMEKSSVPNG